MNITREINITYNNYDITQHTQIDKFNFTETYTEYSFDCDFLVLGDSPSDLVSKCQALETALKEWNKDFVLTFGGTTHYNWSHTANTGFLARPHLEKIADKYSSETSRHYHFSLTCQRPADQAGYGYRQEGKIYVSHDQWRKQQISFSGKYTAGGGKTAVGNYSDNSTGGLAWAESLMSGFSGIFDLHNPGSYEYEMENKVLYFSDIRYKEREQYINIDYDAADRRTVTLRGSFSADDVDDALTIYENNAATWALSVLDDIDNTVVWELISKNENYEQDKNFIEWVWQYRERQQDVAISYNAANQRVITLTGTYSDTATQTAREVYDSTITAWVQSVLSDIDNSATFELIEKNENYDEQKDLLSFKLIYKELLAKELDSGYTDKVTNAVLNYSYRTPNRFGTTVGFKSFSEPIFSEMTVNYSAYINKELINNNNELEKLYRTKIRPYILSHIRTVLNTTEHAEFNNIIINNDQFNVNETSYQINATINLTVPQNYIIQYTEEQTQVADPGISYEKLWDGQDYTYSIWGIGKSIQCTQTVNITQLNSLPAEPPGLSGEWLPISSWSRTDSAEMIGVPGDNYGGNVTSAILYHSLFSRHYLYVSSGKKSTLLEIFREYTEGKKRDDSINTGYIAITPEGSSRSK